MSGSREFDLGAVTVRELNQFLHTDVSEAGVDRIDVRNPNGLHSIAAGLDCAVDVEIHGHAGYFIAGMNKLARVTIHGNVGWSVGENMMSGRVHVKGHASESAGASAHGGLLVIDGDASSRCGISLKGGQIVVAGDVGHFSAFMAQAGIMVVCGDAGANLGDSLYEAVIYVGGEIESLGADAREEAMTAEDVEAVRSLLAEAGRDADPAAFRRVASARSLYHWNADAHQEY
tara:strand:- start:347 stop:1039 length:693 start_codon:yes stop_codon:yes gene_type:complete